MCPTGFLILHLKIYLVDSILTYVLLLITSLRNLVGLFIDWCDLWLCIGEMFGRAFKWYLPVHRPARFFRRHFYFSIVNLETTLLELLHQLHDIPELNRICRSRNFEVLKLVKGKSVQGSLWHIYSVIKNRHWQVQGESYVVQKPRSTNYETLLLRLVQSGCV